MYTFTMDLQPTASESLARQLGQLLSGEDSGQAAANSGVPLGQLSAVTSMGAYAHVAQSEPPSTGITETGEEIGAETETGTVHEHTPSGAVHDDESEHECCGICQEPLERDVLVRRVNRCGHCFHHQCIERWFAEHQTCPLCMQNVMDTEGADVDASTQEARPADDTSEGDDNDETDTF